MLNHSPRFRLALTLAAAALVAGAAQAQKALPRLQHPTGRITYKLTGDMMSGTMVNSWIESGKKMRQETKGTVTLSQQQPMPLNTWTIFDGTHLYALNPFAGRQVMKMKLPKEGALAPSAGNPLLAAALAKGKVVGKEKILGKECEIRTSDQGKVWVWQGLPLKVVGANIGPGVTMVATKIETAVKISPSLFKVPAGYTVQESEFPTGAPVAPGRAPAK